MTSWLTRITVVLLNILLPALLACGAEPVAPGASGDRPILVLKNGQILEGRISQSQDGYVVDLGDGQIRVKSAEVDLICNNLEEGYQHKRAAIQVGNVHHHLELAQWCLRHDLLGPAATELADAVAADPTNPMIGALQHRLKLAMEPPAEPAAKAVAGPTNEDLDRLLRALPPGTVETFTQSVQPVLMNHCATGGCHGPQSSTSLRLYSRDLGQDRQSTPDAAKSLGRVAAGGPREPPGEQSANGAQRSARHGQTSYF